GNSPGILTIQGNYTQTSTGVLEIEVGGLTPGTQHDRLDVVPDPNQPGSGVATLAGGLRVPLINGYVPPVGSEITFLNAANITGQFNFVFMPNPQGRASELIPSATDMRMTFVASTSASQNAGLSGTVEWSSAGTWSSPVPVTTDVVELTNTAATDLRVEVSNDDAFVHQLEISGDQATTTVAITNQKYLSSTAGVQVN